MLGWNQSIPHLTVSCKQNAFMPENIIFKRLPFKRSLMMRLLSVQGNASVSPSIKNVEILTRFS
jgi:hypothetical protein